MKKAFTVVLFTTLTVFFVLSCYAEKVAIHVDGREWELGNSAKDDQKGIVEYVLKGESVQNWSELVTAQIFFGLQEKVSPEEYMLKMKKYLEGICPEIKWNVLKKRSKDIMFEWEIKNCPGQDDQYEITRILSGKEGIHIIHYATKKLPISSSKRDEWIKLIDAAKLVSTTTLTSS